EDRVFQSEAILGLIHAEAARPARARRKEDVVVQNLLAREALFLKKLEVLHKVADREIGGIALAVIAKFLAGLEGGDIRYGQLLATIAAALEDGANQIFVLPGKAAEQNRHPAALVGCERPLYRTMEVLGLVQSGNLAQAGPLGFYASLDLRVILHLDDIRRHV